MKIFIQVIDGKTKSLIFNPDEEQLEDFGSRTDDREQFKEITLTPIGILNPDLFKHLAKNFEKYTETNGAENWFDIPRDNFGDF
jgi:hypothetical protein